LAALRPSTASRVLLVSNSLEEREHCVGAFASNGYCTLLASTATDACRLAGELPPAIVVIAVALSVCEDGVPLVRRLKQDDRLRGVPVVILAGRSDLPTHLERAGCDLFVASLGGGGEIAAIVARLVRRPRRETAALQPAAPPPRSEERADGE
jgi:PleD family two-component response regulator